jgi:hypothetical protein
MEREVLSRLGIYPWECVFCRRRRYFLDEGRGTFIRKRRPAPLEDPGPADI